VHVILFERGISKVIVFVKPSGVGDRDSYPRNQASQLTVSALENERTGVIYNKQKTLKLVCFDSCEVRQ
jgi:hypothetical protein